MKNAMIMLVVLGMSISGCTRNRYVNNKPGYEDPRARRRAERLEHRHEKDRYDRDHDGRPNPY
ncbi:hypothetical protein GO755_23045 [Spirosoma sp. HMF4905]|uniref:Uncharacterized protein n=1 Tax=Spirosoma arboris TaxID=2682092 RepID=A0A7K1SH68_9BACT|nr:hypothetical protein [Spirosoma arboris]MVM32936.1 hypothetical protein [Spirosoma arboris]